MQTLSARRGQKQARHQVNSGYRAPAPASGPQCCSAAVVQGTDRGVAADLVTADCSTPAAAAAGHMGPLVLGPDAGVSVPSVLGRGLGIGSISVILHNWAPAAAGLAGAHKGCNEGLGIVKRHCTSEPHQEAMEG